MNTDTQTIIFLVIVIPTWIYIGILAKHSGPVQAYWRTQLGHSLPTNRPTTDIAGSFGYFCGKTRNIWGLVFIISSFFLPNPLAFFACISSAIVSGFSLGTLMAVRPEFIKSFAATGQKK